MSHGIQTPNTGLIREVRALQPAQGRASSTPSAKGISWIFGLGIALAAGSFAAWKTLAFWSVEDRNASILVILTALVSTVIHVIFRRIERYPLVHRLRARFFSISIALLAVIFVLAFARLYYSRSFLLVFFVASLGWMLFEERLTGRRRNMRLGMVPGGDSAVLKRLSLDLIELRTPELPQGVDGLVVDLHATLSEAWLRLLANCSLRNIPIFHSAVVYEGLTGRMSLGHLTPELVMELRVSPVYLLFKQWLEIAAILLLSPIILLVMLAVAIAIRLDSQGAVFFWQERVGQGETIFQMLKFRTMVPNADFAGAQFAHESDTRVTRIGKFLRKYRLDELPQLWNVLKGEMSIVGPRPEQKAFVTRFNTEIPFYSCRHIVKPGITGWSQVTVGYAADHDSTRNKLEHDLFYIKNFSLSLDLIVVFKTIRTILTGFGSR